MSGPPSPAVDRAISCGLVIGVICMTLLILGVIMISAVAQ